MHHIRWPHPILQEESFVALEKSDSAGWAIRAEIQSSGSVANGM